MFAAPSPWVVCWATGLPAGTPVLDVACGSGCHVCWPAARDPRLTGVDRDAAVLPDLAGIAETIVVDIEGDPWPLPAGVIFDVAVVTNYLYRSFWPHLLVAVAPGDRLVYETFADENETVEKPSSSAFLLTSDELLDIVRGPMRVIGYEGDFLASPRDAYLQWICAVRELSGAVAPRYAL